MTGATRLRSFVLQRDPQSLPESPLERKFLRLLEKHRFPQPPDVQRVVNVRGSIVRVDFAYPQQRVVVEVDSYRHHSGRAAWERDRARRNKLEALGWRVLHATAEQIRERPNDILVPLRSLLEPQLDLLGANSR